ncbi:hydantoinase/oxoprolinase family protein [Futiania mangrovi]|uniref:Hydantoinase/oxoprolinase family protein n=1 Tax=Futiania mangrovi TaxID=2959716 RepID=A0A9J6PM28_9PROT|nr:hydantoinase/oxoprolinase family protein [Futiania mangrovii]MCP1337098.1 hydantoinase/oxoprolinase family protein [Futiania mangrovii]
MSSSNKYDIGIDIGGTFTDVVCRRPGEPMRTTKIMSTRQDPSQAVMRAVGFMVENWGIAPEDVGHFLHGTTVATNAVLERKGARIGLLTTEGFKDVLEIGRQMRHALYGVILEPETPIFLAPGKYRKEIPGRIDAKGKEVTPLDEDAVRQAVRELRDAGVQAIAVCYIFSFQNPAHEQRTREIIAEEAPDLMVSISSDVDPAFREYERTVVTSFDAYMKPVIDRYMEQIEGGLGKAGIGSPLQVMQSRGGLSISAVARKRPVRLFMSGPAAGVIGGTIVGKMAGSLNLITVDIGGTSCDIALVDNGQPVIRPEGRIDGYTVRVPMVDVNAIGSGGGSIAWLDAGGGLRVGPESAGADPGPAAYGKGGENPTVTDASLVLGYLDPSYFAGGTVSLDTEKSREAILEKIAKPLGLGLEEAALGIHRVVNAQMVEGIRLVSIRQGLDPRRFALVALGGGGPVHATALASELKIGTVVIPRYPGVLSAAGLLAAPIEHEVAAAYPSPLEGLSVERLKEALGNLDRQCAELMAHEGVDPSEVRISYSADMWYQGQSYYLEVPIHLEDPDPIKRLYADFLKVHDRVYGYASEAPAGIVNLRTIHSALGSDTLGEGAYVAGTGAPVKGERTIRTAAAPGGVLAKIYERANMPVGFRFEGPAIVEQADTTTVVEPGWRGEMMADGNLVLTASEGGS